MKIENNPITKLPKTQATKAVVRAEKTKAAFKLDTIELHENKPKQDVQALKGKVVEALNQDFTSERVLALKQQIQNGTYSVDHRKVAEAILAYQGEQND